MATTYLDLFLNPSRKNCTNSWMSSALADVKVYSSPLTVVSVKLELSVLVVLKKKQEEAQQNKEF